jgi:hypothetical protein
MTQQFCLSSRCVPLPIFAWNGMFKWKACWVKVSDRLWQPIHCVLDRLASSNLAVAAMRAGSKFQISWVIPPWLHVHWPSLTLHVMRQSHFIPQVIAYIKLLSYCLWEVLVHNKSLNHILRTWNIKPLALRIGDTLSVFKRNASSNLTIKTHR